MLQLLMMENSRQSLILVLFGGFAPIGKKVASEDDIVPERTQAKLYSIIDGQIKPMDDELKKSLFENNKCCVLDCCSEVFVWVGRVTQLEERKSSIKAAEEFIAEQNRPKSTQITRVIQGYETHSFKSNFDSWPTGSAPVAEEGRGKVAALLKQQGVGVKGANKNTPVNEEVPPLLDAGGKLEVPASLNSYKCFLLQSGNHMFNWHGNQSTFEHQQIATKVAEFLKPGTNPKHTKEGTESSTFWFALGGKQAYTSKKVVPEVYRDPHLFAFSFHQGKFEVEEIYNFSQDDLLTEDILILDTHAEVFVWVGQSVDPKEKQNTFEIGLKYVEMAASLEGLSPKVPLYKITEGNEPCFFTTFFSWDPAKAMAHGNSFQKKLMLLFGAHSSEEKSNGTNQGGPTQRASALAALNSAFSSSPVNKPTSATRPAGTSQASQRAAAVAALSSVLTAEKKNSPNTSPLKQRRSQSETSSPVGFKSESELEESKETSEVDEPVTADPEVETNGEDSEPKAELEQNENSEESSQSTFSYEQLKVKSTDPVTGIDFKRREAYLSDEEFQTVFGMAREDFYKIPKWKQDMIKKKVDLF